MSPIKDPTRYPTDWKQISRRIKERANWRCECTGECGVDHFRENLLMNFARCEELHGFTPLRFGGDSVVLTVAHLDHTPENCGDENLRAMCQRCHNRYDMPTRIANRCKRLQAEAGQLTFEEEG